MDPLLTDRQVREKGNEVFSRRVKKKPYECKLSDGFYNSKPTLKPEGERVDKRDVR